LIAEQLAHPEEDLDGHLVANPATPEVRYMSAIIEIPGYNQPPATNWAERLVRRRTTTERIGTTAEYIPRCFLTEPFWSHMLPTPYYHYQREGITLYHGDYNAPRLRFLSDSLRRSPRRFQNFQHPRWLWHKSARTG
jgi:hypothetical protein